MKKYIITALIAIGILSIGGMVLAAPTTNYSLIWNGTNFVSTSSGQFTNSGDWKTLQNSYSEATSTTNIYDSVTGSTYNTVNHNGIWALDQIPVAQSSTTAPIVKVRPFGDSIVSGNVDSAVDSQMIQKYGYAGYDFYSGSNSRSCSGCYGQNSWSTWVNGFYFYVGAADTVTFYDPLAGSGAGTLADTIKVYYFTGPGQGTFKIQTSTDGGSTWSDEAGYTAINTNTATSGVVAWINKPLAYYQIRVVGVSGTSLFEAVGAYQRTPQSGAYVMGGSYAQAGASLGQLITVPDSILKPFVAADNPAAFYYIAKEESTTEPNAGPYFGKPYSYVLDQFYQRIHAAASSTILFMGSPVDTADDTSERLEGEMVKSIATHYNQPYLNLRDVMGSSTIAMQDGMLNPDGIHPSPTGRKLLANYIINNSPLCCINLATTTFQGGGGISLQNSKGVQVFSADTNGVASSTSVLTTTICLTGDTCRTTWPSGSVSGGSPGTVTTWLNATTLTSSSTPTAQAYTATSTSAISNFLGGLNVHSNTLVVDATGNNVGVGSSSPNQRLTVVDAGNAHQNSGTIQSCANNQSVCVSIGYQGITEISQTGAANAALNLDALGSSGIALNSNATTSGVGIMSAAVSGVALVTCKNAASTNCINLRLMNSGAGANLRSDIAMNSSGNTSWYGYSDASSAYQKGALIFDPLVINNPEFGCNATSCPNGGKVSVGSTTPWATLSVSGDGSPNNKWPLFVVSTSTQTNLIVTNSGSVGVATTSPTASLDVFGYGRMVLNATSTSPDGTTNCTAAKIGFMFFNTANNHEWGCNGTTWVSIF